MDINSTEYEQVSIDERGDIRPALTPESGMFYVMEKNILKNHRTRLWNVA